MYEFIYDCGIKRGFWQKYLVSELITHNYVLCDQKMVQAAKVWFQMIYSIQEKLCDARSRGDSIFGQKVVFFSWCSNLFQRECSVLETIWNLRKKWLFFSKLKFHKPWIWRKSHNFFVVFRVPTFILIERHVIFTLCKKND